jgi:hypothetical protein
MLDHKTGHRQKMYLTKPRVCKFQYQESIENILAGFLGGNDSAAFGTMIAHALLF